MTQEPTQSYGKTFIAEQDAISNRFFFDVLKGGMVTAIAGGMCANPVYAALMGMGVCFASMTRAFSKLDDKTTMTGAAKELLARPGRSFTLAVSGICGGAAGTLGYYVLPPVVGLALKLAS